MKRLIAAILLLCVLFSTAAAETDAWIICKASSYVNARALPKKQSDAVGRLELGDRITLTGKEKNGYAQAYGFTFEAAEWWVFKGYLVYDEPRAADGLYHSNANGRTALRRWVNGPRRAWAKKDTAFRVYAISNEWTLTSKGFIRTEYIEPEEEK